MLAHRYPVNHTFDNDNRPIHNQPEVNSSQAHQVARYAKKVHQRNGKKHGQRNNRSHNKPCTQIAQQQYQNKNNNQCPFNQVFGNSSNGTAHRSERFRKGSIVTPLGNDF